MFSQELIKNNDSTDPIIAFGIKDFQKNINDLYKLSLKHIKPDKFLNDLETKENSDELIVTLLSYTIIDNLDPLHYTLFSSFICKDIEDDYCKIDIIMKLYSKIINRDKNYTYLISSILNLFKMNVDSYNKEKKEIEEILGNDNYFDDTDIFNQYLN